MKVVISADVKELAAFGGDISADRAAVVFIQAIRRALEMALNDFQNLAAMRDFV